MLTTVLSLLVFADPFASWRDRRHTQEITVDMLLELAVVLMFGWQAMTYRGGVSQREREDEDDE